MDFYGVDQVYSKSGVDLTRLRANLNRPVADRFHLLELEELRKLRDRPQADG